MTLEKVYLLPATASINGDNMDPIVICTPEEKEKLLKMVQDIWQMTGYHIQFFERGPV